MTKKKQEVGKVPNLRFPEFEEEWEEYKLSDIAEIIGGGTPDTSKEEYWNGEIQWFTPTEIKADYVSKSQRTISNLGLKKSSAKLLPKGTILLTTRATIGDAAITTQECCTNQGFQSLIARKCNNIFVFNWLKTIKNELIKKANGSTFLEISKNEIGGTLIKLPSFPEQSKIAGFLSLIDCRIEKSIKIIHQLETLIKNLRDKIFKQQIRFKNENGDNFPEWEVKKLGEIAKIFDGTHQTPNYVDNGIPFFSVENVTANNFTNTKYISKDVFERENKRVKIEQGDILMTRIGDIGTVRYIDWEAEASFYVSLALIKQSEFYNSEYLAHYFATDKFQSELWNRTIHVAFPKKINLGEIGECLVSVPCDLEQTYIANFLTVFASKIETEKKILQLYKNQKAYLLQNMFI